MRKKKRNGAFTLIEIMIVIAVMGVILGILLPSIGMKKTANIQATAQSIVSLYTAANSWMSNEGANNYTGIDIDELIADALVPGGFDKNNNIYGGTYAVAASASDATSLVITLTSIPTGAGEKIAAKVAANATSAVYAADSTTLTVTY